MKKRIYSGRVPWPNAYEFIESIEGLGARKPNQIEKGFPINWDYVAQGVALIIKQGKKNFWNKERIIIEGVGKREKIKKLKDIIPFEIKKRSMFYD